jgi:hypothetical protein
MRQKSLIKLAGSSKDLTFYKSGKEHLAKRKNQVSRDALKSGANYARTRENNAEFAHASQVVKLLLDSFRVYASRTRLMSFVRALMAFDTVSERGKRHFQHIPLADLRRLEGFNFAKKSGVKDFGLVSFECNWNSPALNITCQPDAFSHLFKPQFATHFRYFVRVILLDLSLMRLVGSWELFESPVFALGGSFPTENLTLNVPFSLSTAQVLWVVGGLAFFSVTNGVFYPVLYRGSHVAANVVGVFKD